MAKLFEHVDADGDSLLVSETPDCVYLRTVDAWENTQTVELGLADALSTHLIAAARGSEPSPGFSVPPSDGLFLAGAVGGRVYSGHLTEVEAGHDHEVLGGGRVRCRHETTAPHDVVGPSETRRCPGSGPYVPRHRADV